MDDYDQVTNDKAANKHDEPAGSKVADAEDSQAVQSHTSQIEPVVPSHTHAAMHIIHKIIYVVIVIIVGVASGVAGSYWYQHHDTSVSQQKQVIVKGDTLVSSIANRVSPSVVSITTKQLTQQSIFGGASVSEGAGTGVILTKDGLVLTNKHVVPDGISSVSVVLSDGSNKAAEVLARDPLSDIAFVKIKGVNDLKPAVLGDSSQMKVGDSVVAIGNALGQFQNTVTTGIISGIGRPITAQDDDGSSSENLQNLFQTDAAINPGNSGGPLVNVDGQIIGINTAVAGDAQNIGFAMPINDIKASIASVEKSGKVVRPYLGIKYVPLTPDIAKQLDLQITSGAYVGDGSGQSGVVSGSPADKAGIQDGDVITKVNNQLLDATHDLGTQISQYKVGDTVTLTLVRDSKTLQIKVKLQAAPSDLSQ